MLSSVQFKIYQDPHIRTHASSPSHYIYSSDEDRVSTADALILEDRRLNPEKGQSLTCSPEEKLARCTTDPHCAASTNRGKIGTTTRITAIVEHKYNDYAWEHVKLFPTGAESLLTNAANQTVSQSENLAKFSNDMYSGRQHGRELPPLPNHNILCFPERLFEMLRETQCDPYISSIVSWQPHGRSFLVHKPKDFVSVLLIKYFRQSKFTSFQRQLNLYGFKRLTKTGKDKGAYYHELFLRGRPMLCRYIRRTSFKGLGVKPSPSPETEPDFYAMSPCHESDASDFNLSASYNPSPDGAMFLHQSFLSLNSNTMDIGEDQRAGEESGESLVGLLGMMHSGNAPLLLTSKIATIASSDPEAYPFAPQDQHQLTTEELIRALSRKMPGPLFSVLDSRSKEELSPSSFHANGFENTSQVQICNNSPQDTNAEERQPVAHEHEFVLPFECQIAVDYQQGDLAEELSDLEDEDGEDDMDYGVLHMLANGVHLL